MPGFSPETVGGGLFETSKASGKGNYSNRVWSGGFLVLLLRFVVLE